tara:strand:- start:189 stop:674 length:486 start_codon:yes stop_codon:yes gene_type:complete
MTFKIDGKTLPTDVAFTSKGINYPANWLRLTTLDEKKAIGITEVSDEPTYDQRFYWSASKAKSLEDTTEKVDGVDTVIKGLKAQWIDQQKLSAGSLLQKYDWYVIRKLEESTDIPANVSKFRDDVRTVCNSRETQIKGVTDVTALKALVDGNFTKWPDELS